MDTCIIERRNGDCFILETDREGTRSFGPYSRKVARHLAPGAELFVDTPTNIACPIYSRPTQDQLDRCNATCED